MYFLILFVHTLFTTSASVSCLTTSLGANYLILQWRSVFCNKLLVSQAVEVVTLLVVTIGILINCICIVSVYKKKMKIDKNMY